VESIWAVRSFSAVRGEVRFEGCGWVVGLDMSRWPSEKHFCSWLNVAPNNRISGGKILASKPRKNANRAAAALRLAAQIG
jgi:hypothetical protein